MLVFAYAISYLLYVLKQFLYLPVLWISILECGTTVTDLSVDLCCCKDCKNTMMNSHEHLSLPVRAAMSV